MYRTASINIHKNPIYPVLMKCLESVLQFPPRRAVYDGSSVMQRFEVDTRISIVVKGGVSGEGWRLFLCRSQTHV